MLLKRKRTKRERERFVKLVPLHIACNTWCIYDHTVHIHRNRQSFCPHYALLNIMPTRKKQVYSSFYFCMHFCSKVVVSFILLFFNLFVFLFPHSMPYIFISRVLVCNFGPYGESRKVQNLRLAHRLDQRLYLECVCVCVLFINILFSKLYEAEWGEKKRWSVRLSMCTYFSE